MCKIYECGIGLSTLDYTIEHSVNHRDMVVLPVAGVVTIAIVIRGRCRIVRGNDVREVAESAVYLRDSDDEVVEYITSCTGVFEQVAVHINTKRLFATDCYVDGAMECRFEHAILRALTSTMPIDEVASECCMSLSTFKRHFRTRFKMSPHRWILDIRLQLAHEILSQYNISTEHVARMCSFSNISYFISIFRAKFGITPSCVRQMSRYLRDNHL